MGEDAFRTLTGPITVGAQRASGLPLGSARTQALLGALLIFRLLPAGFSAADLREHLAPLLGVVPEAIAPGRITYELRRLRPHGLIERIPRTHHYEVTDTGLHQTLFLSRAYVRLFRSGLSDITDPLAVPSATRTSLAALDAAIDRHLEEVALAA